LDEQRAANLTHQNLAPIYEELADAFVHAKDKVVIAKVDADGEGKPLGKKYGVTGYPSENQSWCSCLMFTEHSFFPALLWFDGEGNEAKYTSGRDLDSLASL
jgi:protein disulfide-isomerase A6